MLPYAQTLVYAEMIRDGGSQAATFRDHKGGEWILFLPLKTAVYDDHCERLGFDTPKLFDADPTKRPPNEDGTFHGSMSGPSHELSWENAQLLMAQILRAGAPPHEWAEIALQRLDFAIRNRGQLPPDMEPVLPTRR